MSAKTSPEITIFLSAIERDADELAAYLDDACGDDQQLRGRVDALVAAHGRNSSFLERPAPGLDRTVGVNRDALDAGFSATFGADAAVVIGDTNHSVLKSLSKQLPKDPQIVLRQGGGETDSVVKPSSPELPTDRENSRYQLHGEIARGGMGAIIKGRDNDLGRDLAIKVLLESHKDKPEVLQRFVEEAQIAGQLQHPGIVPVYELGEFSDRRPFFSMKLVKGETLAALLASRNDSSEGLPKLLGIFEQICQTVAYAHSKGVIHRDLKPANIMVGAFGEVQVMDWGLAKVLGTGGVKDEKKSLDKHRDLSVIQTRRSAGSNVPSEVGSQTQMGSVMGTPAYMPPEQALGEIDLLDERADVFGLGAILCEIVTGKPPYVGDDGTQIFRMASRGKLDDCFGRLDNCTAEQELVDLVRVALSAEPGDRPRDASKLAASMAQYLTGVQDRLRVAEIAKAEGQAKAEGERRRRKLQFAIAGLLLLIAAGSTAFGFRQSRLVADRAEAESQFRIAELESQRRIAEAASERAQRATAEARIRAERLARANLPAIRELAAKRNYLEAYELAMSTQTHFPQDKELQELIDSVSVLVSIDSVPDGAEVRIRPATRADREWFALGKTPIERRLPRGMTLFRLEKPGYLESLRLDSVWPKPTASKEFVLSKPSEYPPGMVRVSKSTDESLNRIPGLSSIDVELDAYAIDQHEVTNEEFQVFVDQGGYQTRKYWVHEFWKDDDLVSWDEAVNKFRDTTGDRGPSTWESGHFPLGDEDYPVRGISWYEAAAFAKFSNKSLPTIYHWHHAAGSASTMAAANFTSASTATSNIGNRGSGPAPVGQYPGIGPYGTFDMAGNVKEWCYNETADGERYVLGGAWRDADFMAWEPDSKSPFDRSDDLGFRCIQSEEIAGSKQRERIEFFTRDYSQETPCSDEEFEGILTQFSYDSAQDFSELTIEDMPCDAPYRCQKITFGTAYGSSDPVVAYLYLPDPHMYSPPYQTTIVMPGSNAMRAPSFTPSPTGFVETLQTGRAVLKPIVWGNYERNSVGNRVRLTNGYPDLSPNYREAIIKISKDLGRCIDYLETRSDDIDTERLAYSGYSWGALIGPIMLAVDHRFKAAVLNCGGFLHSQTSPEVDQINFVPRVKAAVLMLNGEADVVFPVDLSVRPMFDLLRLPPTRKSSKVFKDRGHAIFQDETRPVAVAWLDQHLGKPKSIK